MLALKLLMLKWRFSVPRKFKLPMALLALVAVFGLVFGSTGSAMASMPMQAPMSMATAPMAVVASSHLATPSPQGSQPPCSQNGGCTSCCTGLAIHGPSTAHSLYPLFARARYSLGLSYIGVGLGVAPLTPPPRPLI